MTSIQFKRGLDANLPASAQSGEPLWTTDTNRFFIGTGSSKVEITGGSGTVTSVALTAPSSVFSVSGSPVTTSGTLDISLQSQAVNTVFAAPSGGSGTPTFRTLDAVDIPLLDAAKIISGTFDESRIPDLPADRITSGVLPMLRGGTGSGLADPGANNLVGWDTVDGTIGFWTLGTGLTYDHATHTLSSAVGGSGTVTSVALTLPSMFTVSGSPVTSSGTLTGALATQNANTVLAGPTSGGAAAPTFRSLVSADLPTAGRIPSGTIAMYGGNTVPAGWLECDGSAVSRTTYADLFTAIGTAFGSGDGSSTFNLPDLLSRSPVGAGQGTGLTNRVRGTTGGAETVTLDTNGLPAHGHTVGGGGGWSFVRNAAGGSQQAGSGGGSDQLNVSSATDSAGSGGSHANMHPWTAVKFMIKE